MSYDGLHVWIVLLDVAELFVSMIKEILEVQIIEN